MRKVMNVYLARAATPYSESYADLDLPATPYELLDTLDRLRLSEGETPYLQINEYYNFEELAPLLSGDSGLYELNALAKRLSELDELQQASFKGMLQMEVNKKEGQIQMPRLIDLAYGTGCCHVVDATNDSQLGRFYAENGFVPEVDDLSDNLFNMLDFERIGRELRQGEGGVFTDHGYVVRHSEPEKVFDMLDLAPKQSDYQILLELTGDRHNFLELPDEPQAFDGMEDCSFRCLDCRVPALMGTAEKADLQTVNEFAHALSEMNEHQATVYKAALIATDCADLESATALLDNLDHFMLDSKIASPEDTALSELCFMVGGNGVERLQKYVNLPAYGRDLLERDNAIITPYGHMVRDDYQPIQAPFQEQSGMEMMF